MAFITVAAGQPIRSTHVNQFSQWITGNRKDISSAPTSTSASDYTQTVTNEDTSAGLIAKFVYGSGTGAVTVGTINKTGVSFSVPVSTTNPFAGLFTTTGDTVYSSSGATAARLPIGTTNQVLTVSGGVPSWGSSPATILSSAGDILYAPTANTPARLGVGAAYQSLNVNAAGTAPEYQASLQSLLASAGSLVVASGANAPAHLGRGTSFQEFVMNGAGTGQTWVTGFLASVQTQGDLIYGASTNAAARLARGTNGQYLILSSGLPAWTSVTPGDELATLLTQTGDTVYASAANTAARLAIGASGTALRSNGSVPYWGVVAHKNLLINGTMGKLQRILSGLADNGYGLDRWRLLLGAASAATMGLETSDVPSDGSKRALSLTAGSGNNNKFGTFQVVEAINCQDLRGKKVSAQVKLKATAGISTAKLAILEFTGTADATTGDPISAWGSQGTNPTLSASWAYLGTPTAIVPTTTYTTYRLEGVTVGTSANNLAVFIWNDDTTTTTTTDKMLLTDVQLEEGEYCTSFERVSQGDLDLQCFRYAYGLAAGTYSWPGHWMSTTQFMANVPLPAEMRSAPTLTHNATALGSPSGTTIGVFRYASQVYVTGTLNTVALASGSPRITQIYVNTTGAMSAGAAGEAGELHIPSGVVALLGAEI